MNATENRTQEAAHDPYNLDSLEVPRVPDALTREVFDGILMWAYKAGVSDIALASNEKIWARLHGEWIEITHRRIQTSEISMILNASSGQSSSASQVLSGMDVDYAYEVREGRFNRYRFRVNGTAIKDGTEIGIELVLRSIPSIPPTVEKLGIEPEIMEHATPKYGLVLVTGPVGSGKSTLLAAVLGHIATHERRRIITYEAPIEFDLMGIPDRMGPVVQSQVPDHLRKFDDAPRNSLRRAGDVVLFGEARDQETLRNMARTAETGVAVYATVHTNSVSETISRMAREFSWDEQEGMKAALISAMRLIVHQRLIRTNDGQRIALREYLPFTESVRNTLMNVPLTDLITTTHKLVVDMDTSLMADARRKYEEGLILKAEFDALCRIFESEGGDPHVA
jgi:defect-in-organelle-trafficking protein DotB